jgi:hypothetical protein
MKEWASSFQSIGATPQEWAAEKSRFMFQSNGSAPESVLLVLCLLRLLCALRVEIRIASRLEDRKLHVQEFFRVLPEISN